MLTLNNKLYPLLCYYDSSKLQIILEITEKNNVNISCNMKTNKHKITNKLDSKCGQSCHGMLNSRT